MQSAKSLKRSAVESGSGRREIAPEDCFAGTVAFTTNATVLWSAATCRRFEKRGHVRALQSQRDIVCPSFHNQRMSAVTEPALNASHGDVVGRYAQIA